MLEFRTQTIAQLFHELELAPIRLRRKHIDGARQAVRMLRPDRDYPRSFVTFQVTGYRPRQGDDIELSGCDLIADLVVLIEKLTVISPFQESSEAAFTAADVCRRWNVSPRTLARWRTIGLVGCWHARAQGPEALLFGADDVAWFERTHAERIERAATYRRMDAPERRDLAAHVARVISATACSLAEASRRVADANGVSAETVRLAYRRFGPAAGSGSGGPAAGGSLAERLAASRQAGASAEELAERFSLRLSEVELLLRQGRARELAGAPITYVYNPEYDHPQAEQLIFAESPATAANSREELPRPPADLPPYLRDLYRLPLLTPQRERALFRRYNLTLHRAEQARRLLDLDAPSAAAIEHLDALLARAASIRNEIVQSNLRLVVSIARRHVGRLPGTDLLDLCSEGNVALMRAVSTFDVSRGNRFSTYASWAVVRHLTRLIADSRRRSARFHTGDERFAPDADNAPAAPAAQDSAAEHDRAEAALLAVLDQLPARERDIVERRFGLNRPAQTLEEISRVMQVSRERVRILEKRGLTRLRAAMAQRGVVALVI